MGQVASGIQSVGSAFKNPNTFAAEPSGFSGSEWAARFLGAGAKGLASGLQQMPSQQQGGAAPQGGPSYTPTPAIQPQIYDPTKQIGNNGSAWPGDTQTSARGKSNPFFYGYGQ